MDGAWVNQLCKSHLMYSPETLIVRMRDHLEDQRIINGDESIYGVIYDLSDRLHLVLNTLNSFSHAADKCNGKFKFVSLFIHRPSGGWLLKLLHDIRQNTLG